MKSKIKILMWFFWLLSANKNQINTSGSPFQNPGYPGQQNPYPPQYPNQQSSYPPGGPVGGQYPPPQGSVYSPYPDQSGHSTNSPYGNQSIE